MNLDTVILRAVSYYKTDLDDAVTAAKPGKHDHVRSSFFQSFTLGTTPGGSVSHLGNLQPLPPELISIICLWLDIDSAFRFSHTNRAARDIIASIPQYRRLGQHALECSWALLQTGMAPHVGIIALHAALSTERCVCGSFGGYIFLPTAARCCLRCIEWAPAFRAVSLRSLCKASGVPATRVKKSYPVLRSLLGTYSSETRQRNTRTLLISGNHVLEVLRANRDPDPQATLDRMPDSRIFRCMVSTSMPHVNPLTGEAQRGRSCKGCLAAMDAKMCDKNYFRRERLYSQEGFLDHFRDCEEAREVWRSSKENPAVVEEPSLRIAKKCGTRS